MYRKIAAALFILASLLAMPAAPPAPQQVRATLLTERDAQEVGKVYHSEIPESAVIEQAIAAVVSTSSPADARALFTHQLKLRGEAVAESDKPKYWQELRAKPELAQTTIYGVDSAQSQAVLKVIRPALALYSREWDVAVVEQDAPAVGVFRQCILMVSTGLLRLITDEELLGFAAHELAHECFIEELREADRLNSTRAYHLAELKSDLVAALACLLMKRDPLATVTGVARIESYYLLNDPEELQGGTHPNAVLRRRCVELFLTRITLAGAARRNGQ